MSDEPLTPPNTDPAAGADRDFLESAVKAIVDHPEEVNVKRSVDDLGVLITLQVNQEDMKKIIGKAGRTSKALRTLLRVVGSKHDERVNLKILESDGSEYRVPEDRPERPARAARPARPARFEKSNRRQATKPAAPIVNNLEAEGNDAGSAFDSVDD
jgi:hypothetical protein